MSDERNQGLERFEEELRTWGRRPSAISPGAAATRIKARIETDRRSPRRPWGLAWATAVMLTIVGDWLVGRREVPVPSPTPPAVHEALPLPDNIVLWWLDPETPVYFVIRPAEPGEGGR